MSITNDYSRYILGRYVHYNNKFSTERKQMPTLNKKYINRDFDIKTKSILKVTYSFRDTPWKYFNHKHILQLTNPNYIYGSKYAISSLIRYNRKFIVYKPLGSVFIIPLRPNSKKCDENVVWDINMNTVGQQIEDTVCNKIIDSYAITIIHHKMKDLNIILNSETDAYDNNGYPVEITTTPKCKQIFQDKLNSSYIGGCRSLLHFEHYNRYRGYKYVRYKKSIGINPLNRLTSLDNLYKNLKYIQEQNENINLYITNDKLYPNKISFNTLSDIELKIWEQSKNSIDCIINNQI